MPCLKEGADVKRKNIKKECEELWAKNKYYVLSKSHKAYLEIREYLKEKSDLKKRFPALKNGLPKGKPFFSFLL